MLSMSGTPIYDGLYAKYVTSAFSGSTTTPPADATSTPQEPGHDQNGYAGRTEITVWPS